MTATITEPKQTTLYYREGNSDKVYHVSLEQNGSPDHFLVRFAYGRRGSTLQTGTKTPAPVDFDTALRTFNQLVASKVAKGYSPGQDGTPYQHTESEGRSTGIYPQLLTSVEDEHALGHLMLDPLYCVQEKHDGKRLMLRKTGHTVEGINRKGLIVAVPESIVREMRQLAGDCLLDGEAVGDILHVFDVLECEWRDNRMKGVGGTLWAAYNGVTEMLDHRKIRQTADQRLASIWFGAADRTKARALTVAVEMLPHFRN